MSTRAKAIFLALILACPGFVSPNSSARQNGTAQIKPIVIVAEVVNGRIAYKVDSKPALPDLLRVLNILSERRGKDYPVVALVDVHARISEIGKIDGIAGKAQLTNVRFFVFDREGRIMSTIQFGPTMPFSTNPPLN
jgi:hypothetical protein